ncbi:MAG TPA: Ig-like domain-containing protein [Longimicrobiales bacterium]|nr:Ig-like domain-containing protein [Longimicrobiales bacterium]
MATAVALAATLAACSDAAGPPPPPTEVQPVAGVDQQARVATALPLAPVVEVRNSAGRPSSGVVVTFTVATGGGSLVGPVDTTDAQGRAQPDSWTLGTTAGTNTLRATTSAGLTTTVTATALPGTPATLEKVNGDGQTAVVATAVGTAPSVRVRDQFGNPVPGVVIRFAITDGGGAVSPAEVTTDAQGIAVAGSWTLGTAPVVNRLAAALPTGSAVSFTATARAGDPAGLVKIVGDNAVAAAGNPASPRPTVQVVDQFGNPVEGVTVTFAVSSGGGSVTGAVQVTGSDGMAQVGSWTLGDGLGTQTLAASAPGVAPVSFTVTAVVSAYNIDVRYVTQPTTKQRQEIEKAVARWQQVIVGDLPAYQANIAANSCVGGISTPAINETVDDLLIFVDFTAIDGPGGAIGGANFCRQRDGWPAVGALMLDTADLAYMDSLNILEDVVIHEIGHILGISSGGWGLHGLLTGAGSSDPYFTGPDAIDAFHAAGGSHAHGLPVENTGGGGTRDTHWRESVLGTELMTGWISSNSPLSAITIASLQDMGYVVDFTAADPFTIGGSSLMAPGAPAPFRLIEKPLTPIP